MATTARASNLKKPWAWLAALAALCLVLASSTALYVLNPSVKLTLPWWTAIAAPAAIYALTLPLCVPGLRIGGWLAGFGVLSLLHLALGAMTAWLYSAVTFLPIQQLVASAFWSFPPALVLDMVGSLVMTLPFLDTLAPRPANRAAAKKSARPAAAKPAAADGKSRETWARAGGPVETATEGRTLAAGGAPLSAAAAGAAVGVTTAGAALTEASGTAMAEPEPPPQLPNVVPEVASPALPPTHSVVPTHSLVVEEPLVPAPTLSSTNGVQAETLEDVPAASETAQAGTAPLPDFRQALKELFGDLATEDSRPADLAEAEEPPEVVEPSELPTEPVTTATPLPEGGSAIRIPFERVMGQLPPGAFRLPLHQVGAQLAEREMLVVPQALIVPQLGEGVVQVEWDVVAGQFPPEVFAVPLSEVATRIVNGQLLLPLDEIVRQLSRDVFAASMARGPVDMPGLAEFPAPFRPPGWEEGRTAVEIAPAAGAGEMSPDATAVATPIDAEPAAPETLAIEVPDADLVAHDLGLASLPPIVPSVEPERTRSTGSLPLERIEDAPAEPASPFGAADTVIEDDLAPLNIVEIDEVPADLDVDSLLDGRHAEGASPVTLPDIAEPEVSLPPEVGLSDVAPPEVALPEDALPDVAIPEVVSTKVSPPEVAEPPAVAATAPAEPVIRIPFERVMGQLPPGLFRLPLAQVGARLATSRVLLVPQSVVVPQLTEGAVHVTWDAVADQFPADVLAVPAAEVSHRLANGSLVLPLDVIMGQVPPDLFAAFVTRGPVEVPGIEGFPAPFKPIGHEEPAGTVAAPPPPAVVETPAPVVTPVATPVAAPSVAPVVIQERPSAAPEAPRAAAATPAMPPAPSPAPAITIAPEVTRGDLSRLSSLLSQWDALVVDEARMGGFTVITAGAAGLAGETLASAAGTLSALLAAHAPWPVEQATLRAVGGALVLTPVGSSWATGAVIAVGLRSGGSLARLEMLARRAAAGHAVSEATVRPHRPPDGMGLPRLERGPEPMSGAEVAEALDAFGKLTATSFRDVEQGALVHCFLPPEAAAAPLAAFGCALGAAMSAESPAGGFGSFHSAVLRSGTKRLEVRRLPSAAGAAAILLVGGADTGRPGLARLQVERAAARLLGA
jgi:hypothetical protein